MKSLSEIKEGRKPWEYEKFVGIYFLFLKDELVYIGKSLDCMTRIMQHTRKKEFDSYSILEMAEDDNIDILEILYIQKYKPTLNIVRYDRSAMWRLLRLTKFKRKRALKRLTDVGE